MMGGIKATCVIIFMNIEQDHQLHEHEDHRE